MDRLQNFLEENGHRVLLGIVIFIWLILIFAALWVELH